MSLAVKELRRRPGRFGVATIVMTFLSLLLLFLGGLLDGLFLGSTGAIRAQRADAIVYSNSARDSFIRSRIDAATRAKVEAVQGVTAVGGLGVALLGAKIPRVADLADVAVIGYELAPNGVPAPAQADSAWADDRLKDLGARVGDTLLVGPAQTPITIKGFVTDTNFLLQAALWVDVPTWRTVQNANRPDATLAAGVVQVLIVRGTGPSLVARLDAATGGSTKSLTKTNAVSALPGVSAQRSTFNLIIYSTLAVVLAVVALFFSLLTLERTALYGVLKAIGASTGRLFRGVILQAFILAVLAFAVGALMTLVLGAIVPATLPLELTLWRFEFTFIAVVIAAVLGSAISLRRVTHIDPASAIGSGT